MNHLKTAILLTLSLAYANGLSAEEVPDREAMIEYFLEIEEIDEHATEVVERMRDRMIASDKKLTLRKFPALYGDLFEDYREAYIAAVAEVYAIYSDEEIKNLYDFYHSDFGKWYQREEDAFGPRLEELLEVPGKELSNAIAKRRRKGR